MEGLAEEILRESLNFSRAWVAPTDTEDRRGCMLVLASEEWPQPTFTVNSVRFSQGSHSEPRSPGL